MVGMIRKIMDTAKALVLAGAISSCAGAPGIKLDADYAPLTQARKAQIEDVLLDNIERGSRVVQDGDYETGSSNPTLDASRPVIFFGDEPREFLNHLYDFINSDLKAESLTQFPLQKIAVYTLPYDEMKEVCGEAASACNSSGLIYMPDSYSLIDYLPMLYHEIGHSYYEGNREFSSECSQSYIPLKAYMFSKPLGSLMISNAFSSISPEPLESYSPFGGMYVRGALYAVQNLSRNWNDIELALDHVGNSKRIVSETELMQKLDGMGGNMSEKYFQMWKEVLASDWFLYYLTSPKGHLSVYDAMELIEYMKILNYKYYSYNMPGDEAAKSELKDLEGNFAVSPYFSNPFFRAQTVYSHTVNLHSDLAAMVSDPAARSADRFEIAKRILQMNGPYPCAEADPYLCSGLVRRKRFEHVNSYHKMVKNADLYNYWQMMDSVYYFKEFIQKFYPGTDIDSQKLQPLAISYSQETNNYVPLMAFKISNFYYINQNPSEGLKYLRAAEKVNCTLNGWGDSYECEQYRAYSKQALDYLQSITLPMLP